MKETTNMPEEKTPNVDIEKQEISKNIEEIKNEENINETNNEPLEKSKPKPPRKLFHKNNSYFTKKQK